MSANNATARAGIVEISEPQASDTSADIESVAPIKANLIHTCTKLFWRYKMTYEFHFFSLEDLDIIQLLCVDHESEDQPYSIFLSIKGIFHRAEILLS